MLYCGNGAKYNFRAYNSRFDFSKGKGRIGGRKPGLTDQAKRKAKLAAIEYTKYLQNEIGTIDDVCRIVGVSRATLYKYLRIEGINIQGRKR